MNGAEAIVRSVVAAGVEVCFANPGTSELQFAAALDAVPQLRGVLTLFEGVATGAADGYARIAGRPAMTLLHLGPGLGNGLANLHNARRAATPLLNVVGDHATYHQRFDAQLQSDIASVARTVSVWQRSTTRAEDAGSDAVEAIAASCAPPGGVATLVVPADVSWSEGGAVAPPLPVPVAPLVPPDVVEEVAKALRSGEPSAMLLGGRALGGRGLEAAGRVAAATGARLLTETFPARQARGAGLPAPERLAYLGEMALDQLAGVRRLVLAGARAPVSFFAYPGKPSTLVPDGCAVETLATGAHDVVAALEALADVLGAATAAGRSGATPGPARPDRPRGPVTPGALAAAVAHLLPEGGIVVDESITSGISIPAATAHGPRHDWLALTGGAIGQGMPVATGAALADPSRKVLCLEADGSAMYTLQALWTQAREGLDVTTVVLANRSYAILQFELARVGGSAAGERAASLLDLSRPDLDFVSLARGMGVPGHRVTTAEDLTDRLAAALFEDGPVVIEAALDGR